LVKIADALFPFDSIVRVAPVTESKQP